MITNLLIIAAGFCALGALRSRSGLLAAGWLAGASALTAATLASLGGVQVAVLELSVGAGLVTILLVYAISLAGGDPEGRSVLSGWLVAGLVMLLGAFILLIIASSAPAQAGVVPADQPTFATAIWQTRQLDTLLQVVVLFTSGLSLIGFLATAAQPASQPETKVSKPQPAPSASAPVTPLPLYTPLESIPAPEAKQ